MSNPFARAAHDRDGFPTLGGAFPLVGHLPALIRGVPAVMRRARRELGPMFWVTTGMGNWVLFCTGQEALEAFRSPRFGSTHLQEIAPIVAGDSLLAHDGPAHRHMRSALREPFAPRGLSASTVGPMSARILADRAARWAARRRVHVLPEVQEAALEIIFRMIGADPEELPAWRAHYRDLLLANLGIRLHFPGSPAWRAARAKSWIDARLRAAVAEVRRKPAGDSLLSALAHARDDEGEPLTDAELVDNLRLLILGGHETISSTMAWMAITVAARVELWDALCREANDASAVPGTPEETRRFPFAEALFRETVPFHPPFGAITRVALDGAELHGRPVRAGTVVAVDLWGVSHDPALFAAPDEFDPRRWLGRRGPPSAIEIVQFGAGAHFCLGYHLAWLEAVQFGVALARAMTAAGCRPRLRGGRIPEPIYLPTERPPARTELEMVR